MHLRPGPCKAHIMPAIAEVGFQIFLPLITPLFCGKLTGSATLQPGALVAPDTKDLFPDLTLHGTPKPGQDFNPPPVKKTRPKNTLKKSPTQRAKHTRIEWDVI